ncbi:HAMP domain-containing sensor histidine kinase [Pseudonocardia broussonetiae]
MNRPDGSVARVEMLDRFSLRSRIGILAALVAALAVVLVSLAAFLTVRSNILATLDSNLFQRALAAAQSELADPLQLSTIPPEVLGAGDIRIALLAANGSAQSAEGQLSAPPIEGPELEVARGLAASSVRTASIGRDPYRVVAVQAGGGRALVMGQRLDPTQQVLTKLAFALPVVGVIGIAVAGLAGVAVARAGLRPVQRLTSATERVAATGDLRPIPVGGADELARLTMSFNEMLGTLAASQEQQRRLVADAGHELRTPLTSMRTNLELLAAASRPGAPTLPDADRVEILADVHAQVEELTTLVGDLVELARDDAPLVVHQPVELTDVVDRALERVKRRAGDTAFDVTVVPWTLLGDETALERAVLNLLDNAVKWSPPGGTVTVAMRQLDGWSVLLEVTDQGPGIADEDLPRVFDRFYRADRARTMPGSGLGLAIVRQVAVRHGGAVWAGRGPDGGAQLTLRLPGRSPGGVPQTGQ